MSLSTTGAPNNGLVYLTFSGKDASGNPIIEQGSGVLISNDEVLTAAHLVYNPDGSLRTAGSASVGSGTIAPTAAIDGVQVGAFQSYNTVAGMGSDFAVVHLATKVTDGTIFSLGSDQSSGTFQVSGFPAGTNGAIDTRTETLSVAPGTNVYTGSTLDDGSANPNGSSGGSIYQIVNGAPTAYGVISADLASDTTKGFFKELTSADVAQIKSWVAAADGGGATTTPLAATSTTTVAAAPSAATSTAQVLSHSAPGFHSDIAANLAADAPCYNMVTQAAMSDVAAAITKACQDGGSFSDMVQDAAGYLKSTSSRPGRDVAYLAGVVSGTTNSWMYTIGRTANSLIGGSVFNSVTKLFANAGRHEGLLMGINNTGNIIDQGSATLAGVLGDGAATSGLHQTFGSIDTNKQVTIAAGSHQGAHGALFG